MARSANGIFTPKTLLRIAAGVMALHLAGHIFGHLNWRTTNDAVQQNIITQMTEHRLPFMGALHSIGDYYEGYGWISSIAMVFFIGTLLVTASAYQESPRLARKTTLFLAACLLVLGGIEYAQFFPFAASLTWITAGFVLWANYRGRNVINSIA